MATRFTDLVAFSQERLEMSSSLYPAHRWSRDGELHVVNSVEEDDPTWLPHHPNDPDKGEIKPVSKKKLGKKEVVDLLTQGGIGFKPEDKLETLRDTLAEGFRVYMREKGIDFPSDADLEALHATMLASQVA